jgi:hypothetical protein
VYPQYNNNKKRRDTYSNTVNNLPGNPRHKVPVENRRVNVNISPRERKSCIVLAEQRNNFNHPPSAMTM